MAEGKVCPCFLLPPFSDQYNVTTLEKPVVKIYVWVSISSAFHSIVRQKWDQSGKEREKAKRLFDLEKIRNKSSTSDIFHELHFYFNLLTHVRTLVNCKPRTRCQEKIQKNAINDLYLSLWCTPFPTIFMSKYIQRGDCLRERPILLNYGRSCAVTWQGRTRCQMQELICTICISQFYSSEISHRPNFLEEIHSQYSFDKVTVIRLKGQFLWNRPCAVMARRMDELSFARINLPFYIF